MLSALLIGCGLCSTAQNPKDFRPMEDVNHVTDLTLDSLEKANTARPVPGSSRKGNHPVLFLVGNFTMRTGGRTFEAAAFLRRAGADTSDVQRLFQSDLAGMVERYDIIRHAELVHGDIAVAAVEQEIDRVTAAKAADELLTLSGIHASFVLFKNGTGVNLSARSLGEINVQFIMEKLGGGGNSTTAGGQVADASVDEVRARLLNAIDEYMEE